MDKIDPALTEAFENLISAGMSETALAPFMKQVKDLAVELEEGLMWSIKDNLAYNLSAWVADMASRAVEQLLAGNVEQMRRYLSCEKRGPDNEYYGWTGRSDGYGVRQDAHWHPIIHGKLSENHTIELRKKIAQANEALLRDERILDIEDQVRSLVAQVNKANADRENMWQRLRDARIDA